MPELNKNTQQSFHVIQSDSMRESLSDEEQQIHSDAYMQEAAFDLDAVLDDIESTLEENAEEYVSSFVQKGGQ